MYQQLKINTYGFHASQEHYKLGHHVNMQLIKIPTTSYVATTFPQLGMKLIIVRPNELAYAHVCSILYEALTF